MQIVTGCFLSMHYCAEVGLAFASVGHIMRDVNYGFLLRYFHANGASLFFLCLYLHIGRSLYYGGYSNAPVLASWDRNISFDDGDGFYGLCVTLRSNVFLGGQQLLQIYCPLFLMWGQMLCNEFEGGLVFLGLRSLDSLVFIFSSPLF